jgi:hypothetical protein
LEADTEPCEQFAMRAILLKLIWASKSECIKTSFLLRTLPMIFPFARAFFKPAMTRSRINSLSNCARQPKIVNKQIHIGEFVSRASVTERNLVEWTRQKSKTFSKCVVLRAIRENAKQTTCSHSLAPTLSINRLSAGLFSFAPEIPWSAKIS